jgi:hypothetical protein
MVEPDFGHLLDGTVGQLVAGLGMEVAQHAENPLDVCCMGDNCQENFRNKPGRKECQI